METRPDMNPYSGHDFKPKSTDQARKSGSSKKGWKALEKCNPMVLFELSYFDTGCLKKSKKKKKIWFLKASASHPHNYKQPDQTFKKGCVKKVKTKSMVF